LGLYWEYSGTILRLKAEVYRREMAGNEAGMRLKKEILK